MADPFAALQDALGGRYIVTRVLGEGGMARVYLARDQRYQRDVAIKVLRPEVAAATGTDRFLREVAIAARLTHPNILTVLDSGVLGGEPALPFYAMPLVEGESLRERLAREGPLPVDEALSITREIADALQYAHDRGIVHRDIKPDNVLLTARHALVADFGIAHAIAADAERLTSTGITVGTPHYMSPEQAAGDRKLDGRSDVYSLACVAYEMLTGEPPFSGPNPQAILARRATGQVASVRILRPVVPESIDAALMRALAPAAADRFATADAFRAALTTQTAAPVARRSAPGRTVVWLGIVALLGIVAGALLWRRSLGPPAELDTHRIAVAPFDVLSDNPDITLWREGLVDVLSRNLDGAGPLLAVAPSSVVRRWRGAADREAATALGRSTGARFVVFGRVLTMGRDSVRLAATLSDAAADRMLADLDVAGRADRIAELADSLTVRLYRELATRLTLSPSPYAGMGTRSVPALKAFLRGEQFFRRTEWDSARAQFQSAVSQDAAFALALRRIGQVLSWENAASDSTGNAYLLRAAVHHTGLGTRDSLLLAADSLHAALYGITDEYLSWNLKRRLLTTLETATRLYPDDAEAWYEHGEAGFHWWLDVAGSIESLLRVFARAIALDPTFGPAYQHAVPLALRARGPEAGMRVVNAYLALETRGIQASAIRFASQLIDSSAGASPEMWDRLKEAPLPLVFETWAAVHGGALPGAPDVRLAEMFPAASGGGWLANPGVQRRFLIESLAGHGQFARARAIDPSETMPELTFILDPADLAVTREVRGWVAKQSANRSLTFPWLARVGDTAALARQQTRVETEPAGRYQYNRDAAAGYLALARRDTAGAITRLRAIPDSLCPDCYVHRVTVGLLLTATERYAEAEVALAREPLKLFGGPVSGILWELARGRVAEAKRDTMTARLKYRFVANAWAEGDPSARAVAAEARARLLRLTGPQ